MVNREIRNYVDKLITELDLNDFVGVLVYGSYIGKRSDKLSDLDVMIVKDSHKTQDCGSMIIDGVRVEYFIQDLQKLYKLIKLEIDSNDPSHLTKFATCEVLYDTDDKLKEFVSYAIKLYNTKISPEFNSNIKFKIFSINNRLEDLETLVDVNSFYSVYYVLLENIRLLYSKINGIIELPLTKIEKIYNNSDFATNYISSSMHNLPSPKFIDLYLKCLVIDTPFEMLNNIKRLYNYSFGNLDFNPNVFELKFIENAPFKV